MCDDVYNVSWNLPITSQLMTVTVTCYHNEHRDVLWTLPNRYQLL